VTDPQVFYTSQDAWQVPIDPTSPSAGDVAQPPYYLTLQMPGQEDPRYSLTTTFAPVNRETLAAFMAVNSDAQDPEYGNMQVLALPRNTTFPGPSQMQNNIESNSVVSNALLSLRRSGSTEVEIGNLLSLPVAGGLMYVEPVYARATEGASYPRLSKVIVSFGDTVSIADTYEEALGLFFDGVAIGTETGGGKGGGGGDGGGGGGQGGGGDGGDTGTAADAQQRLQEALADAAAAYERGQEALAEGDFATYGETQDDLIAALQRAEAAANELGLDSTAVVPEVPGASASGPLP